MTSISSPPKHTTKQWTLAIKPTSLPVLTGPDATFKLQTVELPTLQEGQVLGKVRYFSNDTGLRNLIEANLSPERLYVPPIAIGEPMKGGLICEIIESAAPAFAPGEMLLAILGPWSELVILDTTSPLIQRMAPLPKELPLTHYLGAFGSSGLAAYTGLCFAGEAKQGQTVVVSAAAGATGSMVVQIALKLVGARRVVGIAGSDAKCAWVKDYLGAHDCVNYKSPTFQKDLKRATPDEVDVYFDAVGGSVLDAVLMRMKRGGTIAVTGAICTYNSDEPMGLRNWSQVVAMSLTVRGYTYLNWMDKIGPVTEELIAATAEGKLKVGEGETVVEASIEKQPEIWASLFSGANTGKLVTKLEI